MGIAPTIQGTRRQLNLWIASALNRRFFRYLALVALCSGISAIMLAMVYLLTSNGGTASDAPHIEATLHDVFFAMVVMIAIAAWPFLLIAESNRAVRKEIEHQTKQLLQEVKARQHSENELQRAKEIADSRNAAKSKYVRGMSHELRTPLNAMLGYAQLLENDSALPDHLKYSIRVIRRSGDHLSSLVDGLLDISMIEAGRLQIRKEEFRFEDFLRQIVDMMSLQARDAGLRFSFRSTANLPELVHTDEKKLRQILINLISNAIRYTDTGEITLRIEYSGQVARFDVQDTGIGIAAQDMERIFNPFERVENPERTAKSGSGLGLTITRHLTDALGGELVVTSMPGQGSQFSVRMFLPPVHTVPRLRNGQDQMITGYEGRRRSVLVVDDDPNQVNFIREALSRLGFLVLCESNGRTGFDRAMQSDPDAILLDISMPDMNGWEVARHIRASNLRRAPIIILSAYAPENSEISVARDIHEAYLMKPVRLDRLLENMRKLMDLTWIYAAPHEDAARIYGLDNIVGEIPPHCDLAALQQLGNIGHLRGILSKLDELNGQQPGAAPSLSILRRLTEECDLRGYKNAIETLINHASQ